MRKLLLTGILFALGCDEGMSSAVCKSEVMPASVQRFTKSAQIDVKRWTCMEVCLHSCAFSCVVTSSTGQQISLLVQDKKVLFGP